MAHAPMRVLAPLLLCLLSGLLAGTALAAPSPPDDRARLSYDENVTINAACYAASKKSDEAYNTCVTAQMAALKTDPSPDRAALPASRDQAIAQDCSDYRTLGMAAYNDCWRRGMAVAAPAAAKDGAAEVALGSNLPQLFLAAISATAPGKHAVATPVAAGTGAALPSPRSVLPAPPNRVARAPLTPAALYQRLARSVFVVMATETVDDALAHDIRQGSAVAVSPHLLLTNCHVVLDRAIIRLVQDQRLVPARLVAGDAATDRCILESEGPPLTPITGVRSFGGLAVGEKVFAIGTPEGLDRTLSEGLVSGLRHFAGRDLIQTSAAVSPGSSGGGLFDERGNLIGITSLAVLSGAENLNFAIAASDYWQ